MSALSNTLSIEQLFAGRLFHVPDYQRGYAWESQQRIEFLEDLEILAAGREHYTGTIVLHEVNPKDRRLDSEGKSYGVVDIVDGQQRLATIVLLLDAIRRALASLDDDAAKTLADGIKRTYIAGKDIAGQPLYKLSLNDDCDHYFKMVAISDRPSPEGPQITSERRLADARKEFAPYLERERDRSAAEYQEWLLRLYQKIAHQLRVSLYQVESAAEVGIIFEVMNNRGKPLSELEKVKNYLLYAGSTISAPHKLDDAVNGAWAEIFRQLMGAGLTLSTDEDQLLRAHWLVAYDSQPRKWSGSKAIKSRFDIRRYQPAQARLLSDLLRYTEGLRASCIGFCDGRSPERPESFASMNPGPTKDEVMHWSSKLLRTNVIAPFLPLLIATRIRFSSDAGKYLELVRLCETFAFRVYRLLGRRADAGQADLFRIGSLLYNNEIGFDEAMRQLRVTLLAFCPDNWFEEELRREDGWYDWGGLKYFLYEYEEHLAAEKGAVPKISWEQVRRRERADTIEHILPQTPTDSYWLDRFDDAERRQYTHDLGNLCLTKDNAYYANKPFPEKRGTVGSAKPCYAESPFFSERELAALPEWSVEQVLGRRRRLVKWALGRWQVKLEGSQYVPAVRPSDGTSDEGENVLEADG